MAKGQVIVLQNFYSILMPFVGLTSQYTRRRNYFLDLLVEKFGAEIERSSQLDGNEMYNVFLKKECQSEKSLCRPIFSFVPPTSGMFIWVGSSFFPIRLLSRCVA